MRVYHFTSAQFALDDLYKRRIKVSRLDDLNDPFELLGAKVTGRHWRQSLQAWRDYMSQTTRLLCFSTDWQNPLMWSHYGDKHKGICLGFEVSNQFLLEVNYEVKRLEAHFEAIKGNPSAITAELSRELLTTKFQDWRYESEVRMFVKPAETFTELGNDFYPFGDELQLKEVIIGPRQAVTPDEVRRALQREDASVKVTSTRLAWSRFRVIDDEPL